MSFLLLLFLSHGADNLLNKGWESKVKFGLADDAMPDLLGRVLRAKGPPRGLTLFLMVGLIPNTRLVILPRWFTGIDGRN